MKVSIERERKVWKRNTNNDDPFDLLNSKENPKQLNFGPFFYSKKNSTYINLNLKTFLNLLLQFCCKNYFSFGIFYFCTQLILRV